MVGNGMIIALLVPLFVTSAVAWYLIIGLTFINDWRHLHDDQG